ncbi:MULTISPECIES: aldo/keto reductase [Thermoactinomyces]|jgi:methylglyoxal/glyoxal reductase|uniref:Aldo/keto reductase n=1 Tax=Thermoactinomyces daqus TaxID=1329516 RepID=A0A7W1X7D7_9BACL|nr:MULTISPECIES: aldo/keto reductase [Thermoactinomyces]MBA4541461.1 aldo/keto reductase [Thermoactinomyces daqus]MBH8596934.1 aldo/keto reductase [Thermoactinomyces sp. CICC 10523]MBH8607654.1 aldo/keto reductase [Thermoactinomyces sp. CICC 10521]
MALDLTSTTTLHNGVKMPWLGLGVYKAREGTEVINAVKAALNTGYRSIDTAALYENEEGVGRAIKESGIPREEIFLTTKVWNTDQGYDTTLKAFNESRRKLGVDYIDLYLIHWPVKEKFIDTWKALETLYREGQVRAIGVSNFQIHHIEELKKHSDLLPMVNQVEYHPLLTQKELLQYCKQEGIQLEAWSPLMRGNNLDHPTLTALAEKHGKTPAQIILRWDLQHGVVTIPKSVREHRIKENADIFDFELSPAEMDQIDAMNQNHRFGQHPDHFKF